MQRYSIYRLNRFNELFHPQIFLLSLCFFLSFVGSHTLSFYFSVAMKYKMCRLHLSTNQKQTNQQFCIQSEIEPFVLIHNKLEIRLNIK